MAALLGGHVMAGSDASSWDKYVDGRPDAPCSPPSAKSANAGQHCQLRRTSASNVDRQFAYGLVGPKGMDPAVMKTLHDAFKRRWTTKHLDVLDQLNQDLWYRSGEDYKWARDLRQDKLLIERLGLAAP